MEKRKIVLITGANRGLGLHLAKKLASEYDLILTSRKQEAGIEAKIKIESETQNAKIFVHQLDVSDLNSIKNLKQWLTQQQIGLDVIVNNAGIGSGDSKEIMDINLQGLINVSEELLPILNHNGKIILITSKLGKLQWQPKEIQELLSIPQTKQQILKLAYDLVDTHQKTGTFGKWSDLYGGFYIASKALVNAYGRYVLKDLVGQQQSVYIMDPGWIKTDMGGEDAPGTLDEGIVTSSYLIQTLPFERDNEYHGKYFNNKTVIEDY